MQTLQKTQDEKSAKTLFHGSDSTRSTTVAKNGKQGFWFSRHPAEEQNHTFQLIFIGPPGSGKTSIIRQYVAEEFDEESPATFGMQIYNKIVEKKDKVLKLYIWDTPDYASFKHQIAKNYENVDAVVFVYDQKSLDRIEKIEEIINEVVPHPMLNDAILVALLNRRSKTYKNDSAMEISEEILQKYGIKRLKTTAKSNERVNAFFGELLDMLVIKHADRKKPYHFTITKAPRENSSDESSDDDDCIKTDANDKKQPSEPTDYFWFKGKMTLYTAENTTKLEEKDGMESYYYRKERFGIKSSCCSGDSSCKIF